jgi:hypothetical protein
MTTKELIQAEISGVREEYFDELYDWIRQFTHAKPQAKKTSIMAELKEIRIDGPKDFSAKLDAYLSGEKDASADSR